jgi:magnesium-protoporphyrin O-methyltransferase
VTTCCAHALATGRLFSFFARRYRRRFARNGLEASQHQLLAGLDAVGYDHASVLEIGCGVGHLHQTLLERGASNAVGIDLAPAMLEQAADWARERGLTARTRYLQGDFMALAPGMEAADVTVLDKVICCYPDVRGLLERTLARTRHACALVYPRDRWPVRLGMRLIGTALWLLRSDFRPYVHDPWRVEALIHACGLRKAHDNRTALWHAQVWVREPEQ